MSCQCNEPAPCQCGPKPDDCPAAGYPRPGGYVQLATTACYVPMRPYNPCAPHDKPKMCHPHDHDHDHDHDHGGHGGGHGGHGGGGHGYAFDPLPIPGARSLLGGLMGLAEDVAVNVGSRLAGSIERQSYPVRDASTSTRAGCGPWKTDGINDHKLCCTPQVGRGGIKVAACIKISRPHDPWSGRPYNPGRPFGGPFYPVPM